MSERQICTSCGKGRVEPIPKREKTMLFRNFEDLEISEPVVIPTCLSCGEEWYDAETTLALELALKKSAEKILGQIGNEAIRSLAETTTQRDIEDLLDLSHGYLSKIKNGKEAPSASLVALLALLAKVPARIDEVRRLWDTKTMGPRLVTTSFSSSARQAPEELTQFEVAQ